MKTLYDEFRLCITTAHLGGRKGVGLRLSFTILPIIRRRKNKVMGLYGNQILHRKTKKKQKGAEG